MPARRRGPRYQRGPQAAGDQRHDHVDVRRLLDDVGLEAGFDAGPDDPLMESGDPVGGIGNESLPRQRRQRNRTPRRQGVVIGQHGAQPVDQDIAGTSARLRDSFSIAATGVAFT